MAFMEDSQRNFFLLFPFVLNSLSLLYYYTYKSKGRRKMKDKIQIGEGFPILIYMEAPPEKNTFFGFQVISNGS